MTITILLTSIYIMFLQNIEIKIFFTWLTW